MSNGVFEFPRLFFLGLLQPLVGCPCYWEGDPIQWDGPRTDGLDGMASIEVGYVQDGDIQTTQARYSYDAGTDKYIRSIGYTERGIITLHCETYTKEVTATAYLGKLRTRIWEANVLAQMKANQMAFITVEPIDPKVDKVDTRALFAADMKIRLYRTVSEIDGTYDGAYIDTVQTTGTGALAQP